MIQEQNLFDHQIKAVDELYKRKNVLLLRAMGSGKTAIALHLCKKMLDNSNAFILYVCPAHTIIQIFAEKQKWALDFQLFAPEKNYDYAKLSPGVYVLSYDRLRRYKDTFINFNWDLIIADEFHRAKSELTLNNQVLLLLRKKTKRFVGMTGSPFQNAPREFFALLSLIAGRNISEKLESCLLYRNKESGNWLKKMIGWLFGSKPNRGPVIGIKSPKILSDLIKNLVDYLPAIIYQNQCGIPSITESVELVKMSPKEVSSYKLCLAKFKKRKYKDFLNDRLDETEIERTCFALSDLRQILLNCNGECSTKTAHMCQIIANIYNLHPNSKQIVFCNFVESGVKIITGHLKKIGIPFDFFIGSTPELKRGEIVKEFKSGSLRVLVISQVGFEGLDLGGTTHVHIADPHFNPEATSQLIARATRAGSLVKNVQVNHYLSVSEDLKNGTIDEAIVKISSRKSAVNKMLAGILCETETT